MVEVWKDIKGYEGCYQVSSLGNVKSKKKWNGHKYITDEKILKPSMSTTGYYKVKLSNGKPKRDLKIHRLVAEAFINNDLSKPFVNHKDGNKLNNCIDNLEWCTASENVKHAIETGLKDKFYISEHELKDLYIDKRMTAAEIAELFQTTPGVILNRMRLYGIETRNRSEWKNKYSIPLGELLNDLKSGKRNIDLAKKYNCSTGIIAVRKYNFKKEGMLNAQ